MNDWPQGRYRDETPGRRPGTAGGGWSGAPTGDLTNAPTGDLTNRYPAGYGQAAHQAPGWPSQPPGYSAPGQRGSDVPPGNLPSIRRRRWGPKRIVKIIAALVVLAIIASAGLYFSFGSKLTRINALTSYPGRPAAGAGANWLLTGSDSRGGLTKAQEDQLALGHDVSGARSDTIMVLHLPANGNPPILMSIPRDSYVQIPGYGYNKINAAYSLGGPALLAETVQNATGLYINHYLGIGVGGLDGVVNDIGGVRMCIAAPMVDPKAGLNLKAGCQTLNGAQALGYVRTRNFALGDLQREQDQRLLLKAVLSKMTSTGTLINPFATIPAADGSVKSLDVDQGTQLYQLAQVAFSLRNPETTTVPFGGFATESVGSVVVWDHTKATELFGDLANDRAVPQSLLSGSSAMGTS
jgi:LCP family protein required for cell wall assembly